MELEEKLEELRSKYIRLSREGDLAAATQVSREIRDLRRKMKNGGTEPDTAEEPDQTEEPEEPDTSGDEDDSGEEPSVDKDPVEEFEKLKYVGSETAEVLRDRFGTVDAMKELTSEDLDPVPGIGSKRAAQILEQVQGDE